MIANVTAQQASSPDEIRELLVKQVTGRVRWTESISHMAKNGCETFVEVGSGKVLSGMVKRIAKGKATINIGEPAEVDAFANA